MDETTSEGLTKARDIPATGGNYHCKSVEEAIVPPALIRQAFAVAKAGREADGFYYVEVIPVCGNLVLRVAAKHRGHFVSRPTEYGDGRAELEQQDQGIKVVTRDLDNLKIHSHYYAKIHVYRWDRMLYAWRDKDRVFIRAVPTPEDWFEGKVSGVQKAIILWSTGRNLPPNVISRKDYLDACDLWRKMTGADPKVA